MFIDMNFTSSRKRRNNSFLRAFFFCFSGYFANFVLY